MIASWRESFCLVNKCNVAKCDYQPFLCAANNFTLFYLQPFQLNRLQLQVRMYVYTNKSIDDF